MQATDPSGMSTQLLSDPHSTSNFHQFTCTNIYLEWRVDFESKNISGGAVLSIKRLVSDNSCSTLILDTSNLSIHNVTCLETVQALNKEQFGSSLRIHVPLIDLLTLKVEYNTGMKEMCTALQWVDKKQTLDQSKPFMYSMCQAIHARSLFPCMDTPSVKQTFSVKVCCSDPSLQIVISGLLQEIIVEGDAVYYKYHQPIPISIDAAEKEFEFFDKYIQHIEEYLDSEYEWTKCGILVLPSSFPAGGMENPCLMFVTPAVISGDKSMVSVLIHELVHNWTGNSVTNATWEHFWLNEGFTKFIERKILGKIYGEQFRQLVHSLGFKRMEDAASFVKNDPKFAFITPLVQKLDGVDPDESFSRLPYEKGALLLYHLEQVVGGPSNFDAFIRAYCKHFRGSSLTSFDFVSFFIDYFGNSVSNKIDWNDWLFGIGLPNYIPTFDKTLITDCENLTKSWLSDTPNRDAEFFSNLHFIQQSLFLTGLLLNGPLKRELIQDLADTYDLLNFDRYNVEVKMNWYVICIASRYAEVLPHVSRYLATVGRLQNLRRLYRVLFLWIPQFAWDTFYAYEQFYHPICRTVIMKELALLQ